MLNMIHGGRCVEIGTCLSSDTKVVAAAVDVAVVPAPVVNNRDSLYLSVAIVSLWYAL